VIAVLNWSLDHWYVFFWLSLLGVFEGVRDFFLSAFEAVAGIGERRHQRRIEEIQARTPTLPPGYVPPSAALWPPKTPGPCVHRNVVPVVAADESVSAWLCKSCDTQLPPDWAVREEDL
jgi:hypothetical protein